MPTDKDEFEDDYDLDGDPDGEAFYEDEGYGRGDD